MSFLIQRSVGRGLALNEVRGEVLRIGRGTQQELRSENPAVAQQHAIIEHGETGYTIRDNGSITGTYVNAKPVESHRLVKGDVIEIGDLRIEVQAADASKPLFLRVKSTLTAASFGPADDDDAAAAAPGPRVAAGGVVRAPKVDFTKAYKLARPYFTKLSLVAVLLIASLATVAEVTQPEQQKAFMPGGVSSAHSRARDANGQPIADNCHACHSPWNGVSSARCSDCHGPAAHAANVRETVACATCHAEHRGNVRLASATDQRCVSCHANLAGAMQRPDPIALLSYPHVKSFADGHPELTYPADRDTLRFNHKLHLRAGGIFNATGARETLTCLSCHKLVETRGRIDPQPIKFEASCQRCHRLTFDARFPGVEVPHGADPGLVYGFILSTYAGNRDIAGKSPEEVRRILTRRPPSTPDEAAVINAEQVIKTKCSLCHDVQRANGRLTASKPVLLTKWLERSKFTHGSHRAVGCESCHGAARTSVATSDVLMPTRASCTDCHGPNGLVNGMAFSARASNCMLCHDYHERSNLTTRVAPAAVAKQRAVRAGLGGESGMLSTILLLAVFVLLLVIFVPVGLALYQRIKPAAPDRAPQPRGAAPPPPPAAPPPVRGDLITDKIPPLNPDALPPAATPRRPAAPPVNDGTRVINDPSKEAPQATEMVQWYGMLHCTSGPLEGQRFIIENDGLYIGRDASMSQIVINDSRISKRHLRIVPRNGRAWAIDQSSTNGTFLAKDPGTRITEVELKRGDTLVLADNVATFVYQI